MTSSELKYLTAINEFYDGVTGIKLISIAGFIERKKEKNMIDKEILKLLGGNNKYIFYTVAFMALGLFAILQLQQASVKRFICFHRKQNRPRI